MSKGIKEGLTPHAKNASMPSLGHWFGNASFQSTNVANTALTPLSVSSNILLIISIR